MSQPGPSGPRSDPPSPSGQPIGADHPPDPSSDAQDPAGEEASGDVEAVVRVGSPFAVDPRVSNSPPPAESLQELGPMKYTAMGAVGASILVVGFGVAAAYFFPAGGTLVAALGCLLSILGMYSSYRLTAACLLTLHLCLFVFSYGRILT